MAQQQPRPPAPPDQSKAWAWRFIYTAFVLSLLFHAVATPLLTQFFKIQPEHQQEQISKVTVQKAIVKPPPTPKPTLPPTPPPTPPPSTPQPATPQPVKQKPQQVRVHVQHLQNNTSGVSGGQAVNASSKGAVAPPAAGPVQTAAPVTPAPAPPTAPPVAACAVPNRDPQPINKAPADYPDMARQQGASGEADVKVTLDPSGHVIAAVIAQSTHNPLLDSAAIAAAKQSSFSPQITNCKPVGGVYIFQVVFSPDND